MSTLPELTEYIIQAVSRGDLNHARALAYQAGNKIGGARGERIYSYLKVQPVTNLKYWTPVAPGKTPWVTESVTAELDQFLLETKHASKLAEAGEKVAPLLLVGETRCGKTSTLASLAQKQGLSIQRLSTPDIIGSYMGTTGANIRKAFDEIRMNSGASILWLMDEIDGVAAARLGNDNVAQERASFVTVLLTELEQLPPGTLLAATTNTAHLMDPAAVSRFTTVQFAAWNGLSTAQKALFGHSHGIVTGELYESYSEVVQVARRHRVNQIIQSAA